MKSLQINEWWKSKTSTCGSVHLRCLIDWKQHSCLNRLFGVLTTDLQRPFYLLYFLCFLTSYFLSLARISAHWMQHADFTCFHCSILTKKPWWLQSRKICCGNKETHRSLLSAFVIIDSACFLFHKQQFKNFRNQSVQAYVRDSGWIMRTQISNSSSTIYMMMPMVIWN